MNILFVCTGNTCRSPMAEAILRSKQIENLNVQSAGIHAHNGMPIADHAKTLIQEADMPFTNESREISEADLESADLILTMTTAHRDILHHYFPEMKGKISTLKGYVDNKDSEDIHDPFGGNLNTYRLTFQELFTTMDLLTMKLMEGPE